MVSPMKPLISIFDLDPDFRKEPKTEHYCALCQRDIKTSEKVNQVRLVFDEANSLCVAANDDATTYEGDIGLKPVGSECTKKVPTDYLQH